MNDNQPENVDRRAFLRRIGLAAGTAAAFPVLGSVWDEVAASSSPNSADSGADPDQLFWAGQFAEADRGYARLLRRDPDNAHATGQRGYLALLSNRFADAERYLSRTVRLAPDDVAAKQRLAECFVRQDRHAQAIPLLRDTGRPRDGRSPSCTPTSMEHRGGCTAPKARGCRSWASNPCPMSRLR